MSLVYDDYIKVHIGYVSTGLRWMEENLDLSDLGITSGDFSNAHWRVTNHDESKYDKEEYEAYDNYFYGGNRSFKVVQDFNYAWLHHIHHNPHHWQYWVLINDDEKEGTIALEMPKECVLEMIADWWSFSWKESSLLEIFDWYEKHRERMILHKNTRKLVEGILFGKMRPKLTGVEDVMEHSDTKEETVEEKEEDDEHKYGVPELKKFPMPDADHVKSAIRFFNYIDPKHEKELADAILERMKEYGMSFDDFGIGDENRFKNYIPKKETKNNEKE